MAFINSIDLSAFLTQFTGLHLVACSLLAGTASILLYKFSSPQQRIKAMAAAIGRNQQLLAEYDGEFSGLLPLIKQNLKLAMRRLALAVLPTLLAAVPIVAACFWLDFQHTKLSTLPEHIQYLSFGPTWIRSWLSVFLIVSSSTAMIVKTAVGIK